MPKTRVPPNLELRVLNAARVPAALLPDLVGIGGLDDDGVDVGGGTFTYLRGGINAALLVEKATVVLQRTDMVERRNSRFTLQSRVEEVVGEGGDALAEVTWRVTNLLQRFAEAIVQPRSVWLTAKPYVHVGETFGGIFLEHFNRAQRLGTGDDAVPELSCGFDAVLDSDGAAWDTPLWWTVECGETLLDLLRRGADALACEFHMQGDVLRAVNAGTGVDHTTMTSPGESMVTLWRGQDLLNGQRSREAIGLATCVLVLGDGGKFVTIRDATLVAAHGPLWATVNASQVVDAADLSKIGETYLAVYGKVRESTTYDVVLGWGTDPYAAYQVGDWLWVRDAGSVAGQRVRVRKITTQTDGGMVMAALTVNDWFDEHDIAMLKKLDAMTRGGTGPRGGTVPGPDRLAPAVPNGGLAPTLATESYYPPTDVGGGARSLVTVTCPLPTLDGNGDPLDDFRHLVVQYKIAGRPGWEDVIETGTTTKIDNLDPGRAVEVRVRAADTSGNVSEPTTAGSITAAPDFGGMRTYDSTTGEEILDTRNGARLRAPSRFTLGVIPGGGGARGLGIAATSNGIELDEATGLRLWDGSGSRTVHLDATTGDIDINGNAIIQGFVSIGGDVDISGSVTIAGVITANALNVNTVNTQHIVANAVTEPKHGSASASTRVLADLAVLEAKIGTGSVTETKHGTSSVSTRTIAPLAVVESKHADGSVSSRTIISYAVSNLKLGTDAVDGRTVATDAIGTVHIAANVSILGVITTGSGLTLGGVSAGDMTMGNGGKVGDNGAGGIIVQNFLSLLGSGVYTGSWGPSSTRESKTAIQSLATDKARLLLDLDPITFLYRAEWLRERTKQVVDAREVKDTETGKLRRTRRRVIPGFADPRRHAGLIVEDVEAAGLGELVVREADGTPAGIDYGQMVPFLLRLVQDHERRVVALEAD